MSVWGESFSVKETIGGGKAVAILSFQAEWDIWREANSPSEREKGSLPFCGKKHTFPGLLQESGDRD